MGEVGSNEREFQGQVVSWLNEIINAGGCSFTSASIEPSLKGKTGKTRFPDIVVWFDRESEAAHSLWELKQPRVPVDDPDLLEAALEKARRVGAHYIVTFNVREAILWDVPGPGDRLHVQSIRKRYDSPVSISNINDVLSEQAKLSTRELVKSLLSDLAYLDKQGHLPSWQPDATFFVSILVGRARAMAPLAARALINALSGKGFRSEFRKWMRTQGLSDSTESDNIERIARQAIYRLIGKVIFYLTLRRERPDLPALLPFPKNAKKRVEHLLQIFLEARRVDYQAVFEEELTDTKILTDEIIADITALCGFLDKHEFARMPQDVIGHVFEEIIPPDERHSLGQYFTPEDLVDFMTAFAVRSPTDRVIDPTCGSGTFLLHAYHRLKWQYSRKHRDLLKSIWGFDIAKFPAQLATMNLYRQDLSQYDNFPRVQALDFFSVKPGQVFEFPPPKYDGTDYRVKETLPQFDAAVGNFPFVRQELIEKAQKGYKAEIERALHEDWMSGVASAKWEYYPDAFEGARLRLSGMADIYAYLFLHTARLLSPGGRMAFITSNAWLDNAFGHELQKFFCDKFKIIAVVESRCEPWFAEAAVNTVFTVLERCDRSEERSRHKAKFVKVKRRLASLIPEKIEVEPMRRFQRTSALADEVEGCDTKKLTRLDEHTRAWESNNFRVRVVEQGTLSDEIHKSKGTVKWGRLLRAPDVYFRLREALGERAVKLGELVTIRRGFTTGINEFFYLSAERARQFEIEHEFVARVIKGPKETQSIFVDSAELDTLAFVCRMSKDDLRKRKKHGALRYIEWGEKQRTMTGQNSRGNVLFPDVPTVKGRKIWYSLPEQERPKAVWIKGYNDRFLVPITNGDVLCDQRLYALYGTRQGSNECLVGVLNSTIFFLLLEVGARVSLGEGMLDSAVYETRNEVYIPDTRCVSSAASMKIMLLLEKLGRRPIKPIYEEVAQKDRQNLDAAVLRAFGLDPKEYLQPIYEGLCGLVEDRLSLAKARQTKKKARTAIDTRALIEEVEKELLSGGAKRFPEAFVPKKKYDGAEINLPGEPVRVTDEYFGTVHLVSESGWSYEASGVTQARYIMYAAAEGKTVVRVPSDEPITASAVKSYDTYVRGLWSDACRTFAQRTGDVSLAENLARELLVRNGLSVPRDE